MTRILIGLVAACAVGVGSLPVLGGIAARGEWIALQERLAAGGPGTLRVHTEHYHQGWLTSQIQSVVWLEGREAGPRLSVEHRVVHGPLLLGELLTERRAPRWLWASIETRVQSVGAASTDPLLAQLRAQIAEGGALDFEVAIPARSGPGWRSAAWTGSGTLRGRDLELSLRSESARVERGPLELRDLEIELSGTPGAWLLPRSALKARVGAARVGPEEAAVELADLTLALESGCVEARCELTLDVGSSSLASAREAFGSLDLRFVARELSEPWIASLAADPAGGLADLAQDRESFELRLERLQLSSPAGELRASFEVRSLAAGQDGGDPTSGHEQGEGALVAAARLEVPSGALHAVLDTVLLESGVRSLLQPVSFDASRVRVAGVRARLVERWEEAGWLERDDGRYRMQLEYAGAKARANGKPVDLEGVVQDLADGRAELSRPPEPIVATLPEGEIEVVEPPPPAPEPPAGVQDTVIQRDVVLHGATGAPEPPPQVPTTGSTVAEPPAVPPASSDAASSEGSPQVPAEVELPAESAVPDPPASADAPSGSAAASEPQP